MEDEVLKIQGLNTSFLTEDGEVRAVDNLDLAINQGEKMALVGETGCGKSVLARTVLRLLPENARIRGQIVHGEKDILKLAREELREIRGGQIGLIPQDPSFLNPLMRVGDQIGESLRLHGNPGENTKVSKKLKEILRSVGLEEDVSDKFPYMLSDGMKQRILISIGIAPDPDLAIADEPTSGLDAIVKNKIVKFLEEVCSERSLLLITHDLEVAKICDWISVMYAGEIIEKGETEELMKKPLHPYTRGLLNSLPSRGLNPIEGSGPSLIQPPAGCKFYPRCPFSEERCRNRHPELKKIREGKNICREVRCFDAFG